MSAAPFPSKWQAKQAPGNRDGHQWCVAQIVHREPVIAGSSSLGKRAVGQLRLCEAF